MTRARELNQLLGPKASGQAFDFILDLHNTTANVGTCLVLDAAHNVFAMHLCHHLQVALRSCRRGRVGLVPLLGTGVCGGGTSWAPVPGTCHLQVLQALWTPPPLPTWCSVLSPCSHPSLLPSHQRQA